MESEISSNVVYWIGGILAGLAIIGLAIIWMILEYIETKMDE